MATPIRSIIRAATKDANSPYNVLMLLDPNNLDFISNLASTNNNFYFLGKVNDAKWNNPDIPKPENCFVLDCDDIPSHIDFDLVLCSNKGFFQFLKSLCDFWHLPLVVLEQETIQDEYKITNQHEWSVLRTFQGDVNVFLSQEIRDSWGQMGYVIEENNPSFCDAWDNIFQEASKLVYVRM